MVRYHNYRDIYVFKVAAGLNKAVGSECDFKSRGRDFKPQHGR